MHHKFVWEHAVIFSFNYWFTDLCDKIIIFLEFSFTQHKEKKKKHINKGQQLRVIVLLMALRYSKIFGMYVKSGWTVCQTVPAIALHTADIFTEFWKVKFKHDGKSALINVQ